MPDSTQYRSFRRRNVGSEISCQQLYCRCHWQLILLLKLPDCQFILQSVYY